MDLVLAQVGPVTGTGVEWLVGMSLIVPIILLAVILWLGKKNTV